MGMAEVCAHFLGSVTSVPAGNTPVFRRPHDWHGGCMAFPARRSDRPRGQFRGIKNMSSLFRLSSLRTACAAAALAAGFVAAPAFADDAPKSDFTITGSVDITTQYRLRGISQTDNRAAIQGGLTVTHSSGFYLSTWASNLGGYGTFGGSNMELDLIGGYSKALGPVTLDGGLIGYVYPGTTGHNFMEIYASASGKIGPVGAKLGTYVTPKQDAIGGHNVWVYGESALPISGTPITLKGHIGYSTGTSAYTHGKDILDYSVGADFTYKVLTLNVSFVGTNYPTVRANNQFGGGVQSGHDITKGNVVATLTAAF
jgi:uncharacterized protein (TIGR02001 family)